MPRTHVASPFFQLRARRNRFPSCRTHQNCCSHTPPSWSVHILPLSVISPSPRYILAHWRQLYFRPNKPLPSDVGNHLPKRRRPILRTAFDLVISCLCLGIPFFFFDR